MKLGRGGGDDGEGGLKPGRREDGGCTIQSVIDIDSSYARASCVNQQGVTVVYYYIPYSDILR